MQQGPADRILRGTAWKRMGQASLCFTGDTGHSKTGIQSSSGGHTLAVVVHTFSWCRGLGIDRRQKAEFHSRLPAKRPMSGSRCLVALSIHRAQSFPKPFLAGGVIYSPQTEKPHAPRMLGLPPPCLLPLLASTGYHTHVQVFCFQTRALSPTPHCLLESSGEDHAIQTSRSTNFGAWASRASSVSIWASDPHCTTSFPFGVFMAATGSSEKQ